MSAPKLFRCDPWRANISEAQCRFNQQLARHVRPKGCGPECRCAQNQIEARKQWPRGVCQVCGEKPYRLAGHGLCIRCLKLVRHEGRLDEFPEVAPAEPLMAKCRACGQLKQIKAGGKCVTCYHRARRAEKAARPSAKNV